MLRNIYAAAGPRVTTHNSPQSFERAYYQASFFYNFPAILATGRVKGAVTSLKVVFEESVVGRNSFLI